MTWEPCLRYWIDAHDVVRFVDDGWDEFATANDAADLARGRVLGRTLWDFIADEAVVRVHRRLIARARGGRTVKYFFRCDAPRLRRLMEMRLRGERDGSVELATRSVVLEEWDSARLLDRRAFRHGGPLRMCSSCNRLDLGDDDWREADEAARRLELASAVVMPRLAYGICDDCLYLLSELAEDAPAGS